MRTKSVEASNFLKLPDRIRDQKVFSGDFRSSAKLVYIYMLYMQEYNEDFSPSYQFMEKRFGISQPTFSKSLLALEKYGYVKIERGYDSQNKNSRNKIRVIWEKVDSRVFSMIPNYIINTDIYTNDQKLFIILLFSFCKSVVKGDMFIRKNISDIVSFMKGAGIGINSIYARIKELSDPNSGFINLIRIKDDGIFIDPYVIISISERALKNFTDSINSGLKYPVYEKPDRFDFSYSDQLHMIIKNSPNRIIKKR